MGRRPNYASSVYRGADGYWHGRVTMGRLPNGVPDRRHVSSKWESVVREKVRALEYARDSVPQVHPGCPTCACSWT
jgi:hypothetical protein